MTEISKTELRRAARETRYALADRGFAAAIARHAEALALPKGTIVGGYHALPDEADPALLIEGLVALGCHAAFPRVAGKGLPLEFHRIPDGEVLAPGAFGIHEPMDIWPRAVPDVLLVPLLAFDGAGRRLGYGGGFYDRTIFHARAAMPPTNPSQRGPFFAVGIAYAGQEVASLPAEPHDMALDAILTEQGLRRFR